MKLQFVIKCSRYPCILFLVLYVYCSLITGIKSDHDFGFDDSQKHRDLPEDVELVNLGPSGINKLPDKAYLPKIKSILIKSRIRFRYARTRIISTIVNPSTSRSHEVTFKLRIPKEAFISKFEMRVDGGPETYKANVTSKEDAKRIFQFAKLEGRTVTLGLIEQSHGNFDEVAMKFIMGAQKTVLFLLVYEERLPKTLGKYESVIHLVPEQLSNKTTFRIEVTIEETEKITFITVPTSNESYHCNFSYSNATIENGSDKLAKITWSNKLDNNEEFCDYPHKEFTVLYSLEDEVSLGHVLVRNGYFVHFFSPNNIPPLRKHVVFVLDISDSMVGKKIDQLQKAMIEILDELEIGDFFNIIAFSNDVEIWSPYNGNRQQFLFPFPAHEQYKDSARYFVKNKLTPHGSTNIHSALVTALQICKNVSSSSGSFKRYTTPSRFQEVISETLPNDVQSIILFFTDGSPTSGIVDKRAILTSLKSLNYELAIPIFCLAFGHSADFAFLNKIASRNNAFARKVYEQADPSLQLAEFYRSISSPILSNINFKYTTSDTTGFSIVEVTNSGYPMIFKGAESIIVGKLERRIQNHTDNSTSLQARVSGNGRFGKISYVSEIRDCSVLGTCSDETDSDDKSMEKLFVYLTIKKLLEEEAAYVNGSLSCWTKRANYYDDWYETDNPDNSCATAVRTRAIELAMEYGFVTPYTSLVMRTKSIFEEETEVPIHPKEENEEWELFLGNMNPLPETSKLTAVRNPDTGTGAYNHQELPEAQSLTGTIDYNIQHPETYNIVDIDEDSASSSFLRESISGLSQKLETSLTLKNITWLPQSTNISSQNTSGNFILDKRTISKPQINSDSSTLALNRPCNSSTVINGTCKHLSTCVQAEYVDDFQLFLQSYWCPIRYGQQTYLGVCCPRLHITWPQIILHSELS